MLNRLSIRNFRLIRSLDLGFRPGVPTVLIGPNGSGKSSVIEAVDVLRSLQEFDTTAVMDQLRGGELAVRTLGAAEPVELGVSWGENGDSDGVLSYFVSICQKRNQGTRFNQERIGVTSSSGLYRMMMQRDDFDVNFGPDQPPSLPIGNHRQTVTQQIRHPDYAWLTDIAAEVAAYQVYGGFSVNPQWIALDKGSARDANKVRKAIRLQADGSNLVNVLFTIDSGHEQLLERIRHHMRREFPFLASLKVGPNDVPGVISLTWTDKRFPGKKLFAEQMSTGMMHYLCLLTAAFQPAASKLIAFDEPETHLHPSAIHSFVAVLEEIAQHKTVLVATHSSVLLDALTDPSGVHICTPASGGTVIERLNPKGLAAFMKRYTLSEMRSRGMLDAVNSDGDEVP